MKHLMLTNDIHSLSEFRSNASGFIAQVHNTKRPLVITQHGKSAAVLLDVNEYDNLVEKVELIQDMEIALGEIGAGKGIAHATALKQLKSKYVK
jgi:antitoxin YefM